MKKYYCIGIKGSGMATLACLLHDLGNEVSGYDDVKDYKFTEAGLKKRNIPIFYDGNHEIASDTIVTYSKAFKMEHPEMVRVFSLGLKVQEYNEVVGELTSMHQTICVCGTHGKTTTTSMISQIVNNTLGCNYFIGDGRGNADVKNKYFVIESDEFNRHFLKYSPTISVVTNIELEHTECYSGIEDIIETFETFVNKTKEYTILCGDNLNIRKLKVNGKHIYFGFNEENDAVIRNLELSDAGSSFDLFINDKLYDHFQLPLYGKHMVLDAVAAILASNYLNIEKDKIEENLSHFQNAARRFSEEVVDGTVIIDDYAHHPTEIKVTLDAIRQKYPTKKIAVVFKPNTYSRTEKFYREFANSLNVADEVFLTEIDCNREKQEEYPGVTSKLIFDLLDCGHMISDNSISSLLPFKKEVICFMSCASIEHMRQSLIKELSVK